jgi:hypothetical protein
MALGRDEATRIVRFCLAGDGWGTATYEGDAHVLKLVVTSADRTEPRRFEGASFEDVLAQAVSAGVLKAICVEKQIAFLGGALPRGGGDPAAAEERGPEFRDGDAPVGASLFQDFTTLVSALVHETQRERGGSSLYAASGGRRFAGELAAQWRATDRRRVELVAFLDRHEARLPSAATDQLARGQDLMRDVITARGRVEDLKLPPTEIVRAYSQLNAELLQIIDGLIPRAVEPQHRSTALAWMALLHAKEKTGIERAQLVSAFERDRFFDGQYQAVLAAIAARQSYLHLFGAAAPGPVIELLRAPPASAVTLAFERMERIALAHRRGGFGIDPTEWFAAVSRQIELLGDVESALRAALTRTIAA